MTNDTTDDMHREPIPDASDAANGEPSWPTWHRQAVDASWALAARDAAIEASDKAMAARFAAEARDAIAAAVDAGATPAELAWELDYPGGHQAFDGPHIDRQIAELPNATPARAATSASAISLASAATAVATVADAAREHAARQEHLARWHHDDAATAAETEPDRAGSDDGWAR
jgi:hypothetical protein